MDVLIRRFERYSQSLADTATVQIEGKVSKVIGLIIEASLPDGTLGELCKIRTRSGDYIRAEIIGFRQDKVLLMPLDETVGISPGSEVSRSPRPLSVQVGPEILGRVIDGMGNPIDGKGPLHTPYRQPVYYKPPNPMIRQRITEPLSTGIRAIDGLLTIGRGQRVGLFSASGVGKSILLGMISRYTEAEINVIGLIGERGREVREFIERDLGTEGLKKSVVVVATSDQAAMVRVKAALMATAISEYFRNQGRDVLLLMDSLTRVAMAQREIGLAAQEPPTTKGYTPSVFALLPRLLERAGTGQMGSITGLYTVLVESDDMDEPISDASRSILDGHIVLSRQLATRGHYPAIDVLESVSRLRNDVTADEQRQATQKILEMLSVYRDNEDLINIGAYERGSNQKIDQALAHIEEINRYLQQDIRESSGFSETLTSLEELANQLE